MARLLEKDCLQKGADTPMKGEAEGLPADFLAVQWSRLCLPMKRAGLIPGQELRSYMPRAKKPKQKTEAICNKFDKDSKRNKAKIYFLKKKGGTERKSVGPRQLSPFLLHLPFLCSCPLTVSQELAFAVAETSLTCAISHMQFKHLTHILCLQGL